ncbi:hypothetical protein LTR91_017989 [Friedmanniomyces endolithicus]|uniref:Uncharacterized protein n=1 Tax=Friedmanniomyces endolithicus TaxID=329885 RepID=A0AAN6K358_9PEZI|nr:hypothetical protein LTR59_008923 [Friedmanniomyces endolithicus]KAK0797460.1 hypothetical protein LTR38_008162 [Friedmanniomyces endolithicus]KAK0839280.1 hypothetical protein LTR03_011354 [Friedmanniomyces endolithicus]KAK0857127.1 hypothetical protein LTS02_010338 [Friedmanniomyces endolithicus]KAK0873890.1 hypothetical protein LTR87_011748 [Friedmanniomyces endolithicus]
MAETIYDRVLTNIQTDPPTTALNSRLFEEATIILPQYLAGTPDLLEKRHLLMRYLAADLTNNGRSDHAPAVALLIKLFDGWTWQQVCDFGTSSIPYKDGLEPGEHMVSFNRLMLCLLSKATLRAPDAAHAASMLDTMQALVRLWLCTPDTGIATAAADVLYRLMKVDLPIEGYQQPPPSWRSATTGAQGWVWKRVFEDGGVYNVFFECCSLKLGTNTLSKNQKTIAQARLMEWLPKIAALDWHALRTTHKDVEDKYRVTGGLLDFVALHMVDYRDDVLMHKCLIDFYAELLSTTVNLDTRTMALHDSLGLQYLIMHGLHARTAAIYFQVGPVDPVETAFLYGSAANYISVYTSEFPKHYLAGQMPAQVNERLRQTLDLTPGKWAHADSPKNDLHVLVSLPRGALLPFTTSPVALLPSKSTNPDVLNSLATLFHGPEDKPLTLPMTLAMTSITAQDKDAEEGAAARNLYFHYLAANPRFWQDITAHADTVALGDLALSALHCLKSVITSNWYPTHKRTAPDNLPSLPSSIIPTPETGVQAILSPPALEYTLPYLLKSAQSFSNLVGGRGDAASATYKIAMAKYEALRALYGRLVEVAERAPGEGYEDILRTVGTKLAEGPMRREGDVGGRVGTMEL